MTTASVYSVSAKAITGVGGGVRAMTLQEKISQANKLAYDLSQYRIDTVGGLSYLRKDALLLKQMAQQIISTARAAQKRKCIHANLDAGHRYIKEWNGLRVVTRHFNCVDCGKSNIKAEVISEESVIRGDD